ncbi:MAG: hypothetical protein ACHQ4H_10815 [Ktedonobacterales bacterium]
MSHRGTHYWLWFLLFGVIGGLLYYSSHKTIDGESTWLLISGLLGIVVAAKWLNDGKFAKPYDLIIGLIFTVVGIVGILTGFGLHVLDSVNVSGNLISKTEILGLSLATFPALINTLLGLTSLNHGLSRK